MPWCSTQAAARPPSTCPWRPDARGDPWPASPSIISPTPTARTRRAAGLRAQGNRPRLAPGRGLRAARPFRLRQVHVAQHHLGPRGPDPRPHPVRRPRRHHGADRGAQHRSGVPVPGRLRHHDGAGEPGLPVEEPPRGAGHHPVAGGGDRRSPRPDPGARPPRQQPDGGYEAKNLARPGPRAPGRGGDPVRRAAHRHRPAPEMAAALDPQGASPQARPDDDLRHPRPDRGADLRRYGGGDA